MKLKSAAAALALVGASASSALALEPELIGSDTLDQAMLYLFGQTVVNGATVPSNPVTGYGFNPSTIRYAPRGSGSGEDAIEQDAQEWAPLSRFLSTSGGNGCADATADQAYAGCWIVARDALLNVANTTATADATCRNLRVNRPGTLGGQNVDFSDWRQVLRIIYAGEVATGALTAPSAPIATRCNSAVRQELVNNWSNLFADSGCPTGTCPTGLKHAFRRDDVSGTTAVFLSLLQLPAIGTNPFCNGTEIQDADPIRRGCAGDGFVTGTGASEDTVCGVGPTTTARKPNGQLGVDSLGLVLPVLVSTPDAYTVANGGNGNRNCSALGGTGVGGGAFGRVAWGTQDIIRFGARCPNGAATVAGTCLWPKPGGQGGEGPGFGCIANLNSRPPDTIGGQGVASGFDARVYNLWARNSDGTVKTYPRTISGALQQQRHVAAFYKIRQHRCKNQDETSQIGCFTSDDPCTIGFAGRSAVDAVNNPNTRALQILGVDPNPTTYAFARDLYICQLDNFGSSIQPTTPAGAPVQSPNFLAAQQQVYNDLVNNVHTTIDPAMVNGGGFFAVPTFNKQCCTGTYNSASGLCQ